MEPPPVSYVRTPDGYDIAYTVAGEGMPFVFMPRPFNNVGLVWSIEPERSLLAGLVERFKVVQYDSRGQGMSTRGLPEYHTIDDYVLDFEAVVNQLGLERFVLYGGPLFGHVAVKYAVKQPGRVAALVLGNFAIDTALGDGSFAELARRDWDRFLYVFASAFGIRGLPADVDYHRKALNRDDFIRMSQAATASSIAPLLQQLNVPTIVAVCRRLPDGETEPWWFEDSRTMASLIPNARLYIMETYGEGWLPDGTGTPPLVTWVEELLRDLGKPETAGAPGPVRPDLSPREVEILRLLARGRSNQQIADELVLSVRTVERHITNLYGKIRGHGRADATAYAMRSGIA